MMLLEISLYSISLRHYLFEPVRQRQTHDSSADDQHGPVVDRHLECGDGCLGLFALFKICACKNKATELKLAKGS